MTRGDGSDGAVSGFFATAQVPERSTYHSPSDGDLWPTCWAADDNLYGANGDGAGFSGHLARSDIALSVIRGMPPNLTGETLAAGDDLGSVWSTATRPDGSAAYNRKPTGMLSVDGVLYLAIQDLSLDFSDVPHASISRSEDFGRTWKWGSNAPYFDDRAGPMFDDHIFTTIMFADFGKDSEHAFDGYVYAFGLDYNWRQSYSGRYPDPQALYLARVPRTGVQDRTQWQFFVGMTRGGEPAWSFEIRDKVPVLEDFRRLYGSTPNGERPQSVISQGSIVYNAPLRRFIYTSWTEYTFEFYEAPALWGPWRLFLSQDFGQYPWSPQRNGGYGTVILPKFTSADGKRMWFNANAFRHGAENYWLSLRQLTVEPYEPSTVDNQPDPTLNLAMSAGTVPISKSMRNGCLSVLNDGRTEAFETSEDQDLKTLDWWGYVWPRRYAVNTLVYTAGPISDDGGWFGSGLRVQVRRRDDTGYHWVEVTGLRTDPPYPYDKAAAGGTYALTFDAVDTDGVRLVGTPALPAAYTSIAQLEVYFR